MGILVQINSTYHSHHFPQQQKAHITILGIRSRSKNQRLSINRLKQQISLLVLSIKRQWPRQTRSMRQNLPYSDSFLLPIPTECRNKTRHSIIQLQHPPFGKMHHSPRRRHHFGQRGQIIHCAGSHRLRNIRTIRFIRRLPIRAALDGLPSPPNPERSPRKNLFSNGLLNALVYRPQNFRKRHTSFTTESYFLSIASIVPMSETLSPLHTCHKQNNAWSNHAR